MRFLLRSTLAALSLAAVSAFAQTPTFTLVAAGLDATFGNAGKGVLEPQVAGFTGVAFGNGLFVAVAASVNETTLRWATSADGLTWTARSQPITSGTTFQTSKVHFLNGKFIYFVGLGDTAGGTTWVYRSADGLTWTGSKVADGHANIVEFDASPTLTVAAGTNGRQYSSSDLVTWTPDPIVPNGAGYDHNDLTYGSGRFISTTNGFGGASYTSADAVTWTAISSLATAGGARVEAGNGVILASFPQNTWRSTDGVTFTKLSPTSPNVTLFSVPSGSLRFAGGRFLGTSPDLTAFPVIREGYLASTDGQTWTAFAYYPSAPTVPAGQSRVYLQTDIAFGNGKYVIAGQDIAQTLTSKTTLPLIMVVDTPAAPTPPVISAQPVAASAVAGGSATFAVAVTGTGNTYQWKKDGNNLAGATSATLTLSNISAANVGNYSVVVTNAAGSTTSNVVTLSLVNASNVGRLINMSIRTGAGTGDNTLIVGVSLGGAGTSGSKAVLIRGVGPTLNTAFGLTTALADPIITAFAGQTQIAQNDDWGGGFDFAAVGAFALSGAAPRDAAIYNPAIPSGSYSVQITGKNNATGIALAEIYDATPTTSFAATTPRLVNVSARTQVGTGDNILIAGFVIGGSTPVRVLVRAIGPTLGSFGVGGTLADPKLEIFNGTTKTAENDNWGGTAELKAAFSSVAAFPLPIDTSRDAALVATLQPGNYTAQISGVNSTTGVALVEVYELP